MSGAKMTSGRVETTNAETTNAAEMSAADLLGFVRRAGRLMGGTPSARPLVNYGLVPFELALEAEAWFDDDRYIALEAFFEWVLSFMFYESRKDGVVHPFHAGRAVVELRRGHLHGTASTKSSTVVCSLLSTLDTSAGHRDGACLEAFESATSYEAHRLVRLTAETCDDIDTAEDYWRAVLLACSEIASLEWWRRDMDDETAASVAAERLRCTYMSLSMREAELDEALGHETRERMISALRSNMPPADPDASATYRKAAV